MGGGEGGGNCRRLSTMSKASEIVNEWACATQGAGPDWRWGAGDSHGRYAGPCGILKAPKATLINNHISFWAIVNITRDCHFLFHTFIYCLVLFDCLQWTPISNVGKHRDVSFFLLWEVKGSSAFELDGSRNKVTCKHFYPRRARSQELERLQSVRPGERL